MLRQRADRVGTRVRDTTAEMTMVTARVMANSRNRRPTTSPMNSSGISTAISDTVSEMMVKPICAAPLSAASSGSRPPRCSATMFSIMTMASSTTKPVAMVRAIRVRLLRLKPSRYITAEGADERQRHGHAGDEGAAPLRRKANITATTRMTDRISSNSDVLAPRRGSKVVRSVSTAHLHAFGQAGLQGGQLPFRSGRRWVMTSAPGWRWTLRMIAGSTLAGLLRVAGAPFQAPSWLFSAALTAVATSFRRTGAPEE